MPPKARDVQIPNDQPATPDAPLVTADEPEATPEELAAAEAAHEATVAAAVAPEPEPPAAPAEPLPEPDPHARHTRMQLAEMSAREVFKLYGESVNYPDGTALNENREPLEAGQAQAFYVGRILSRDGWLIGVAVPIDA